jgi:hypothetical protein
MVAADPAAIVERSVSEAAQLAGVSEASVVRCCQSLGLSGFLESTASRSSPRRGDLTNHGIDEELAAFADAAAASPDDGSVFGRRRCRAVRLERHTGRRRRSCNGRD